SAAAAAAAGETALTAPRRPAAGGAPPADGLSGGGGCRPAAVRGRLGRQRRAVLPVLAVRLPVLDRRGHRLPVDRAHPQPHRRAVGAGEPAAAGGGGAHAAVLRGAVPAGGPGRVARLRVGAAR